MWEFDSVPGQVSYALPSDWIQPVNVLYNGVPLPVTDPVTAAELNTGALYDVTLAGFYYINLGSHALSLWPEPSAALPVQVQYVYTPPALVLDSDVPSAIPEQYQPALLLYIAGVYYSTVEDNAELATTNDERYLAKAGELERFRISQETGDQPFNIGIQGVTAY